MLTVLCEACLEPMSFKGANELYLLIQPYVVCHMCNYETVITDQCKQDIRAEWSYKK